MGEIDTRRYSPLLEQLAQLIKQSGRTNLDIAQSSGVTPATLSAWFHRHNPTLQNFEAVLTELGYELQINLREK
jgi:transcriptional regulator with XRE-family HTH domain|tara:strand:+ start:1923 stop:2144 length:222 start_codon:yes stop_codon:yes gene_type:complete